jgi:hypothetical protein
MIFHENRHHERVSVEPETQGKGCTKYILGFWLDPGRAAALAKGSALGMRVQLRVLFV